MPNPFPRLFRAARCALGRHNPDCVDLRCSSCADCGRPLPAAPLSKAERRRIASAFEIDR